MVLRCPYCHASLPPPIPSTCPACGRAMRVPDHLRLVSFRERRRARERVHRALEVQRGARGRIPSVKRSPLQLLMILLVMAFLGAMLITRARQAPAPPPAVTPTQRAQSEVNVLRAGLEQFRQQCGRYPAEREGLTALISRPEVPGWRGPYVTLVRADPWRNPYVYASGATGVMLFSCGPDGQPETTDDVVPRGWEGLLERALRR